MTPRESHRRGHRGGRRHGEGDADDEQAEGSAARDAAHAEVERLRARAQEADAEAATLVDDETLERLASLRAAVAGEVASADGLAAIRAALRRVFASIALVRTPDGELVLVPEVASFQRVESFTRVDGRSLVKPLPERVAVPATKQAATNQTSDRSLLPDAPEGATDQRFSQQLATHAQQQTRELSFSHALSTALFEPIRL